MRIAKLLLIGLGAAMALMAGLFAAVVAVVAIAVFNLLRLLGRSTAARPRARVHHRPAPQTPPADAIEVTATEVPSDRIA